MIDTGTGGEESDHSRARDDADRLWRSRRSLADPTLELYQGDTPFIFRDDDWRNSSQQAEIASSGLAPNNDAESAIIWTLAAGQGYTAIVRGKNGQTGIGVVEAFDLDRAAASKLGNISTRGFVDADDGVMIAGMIVDTEQWGESPGPGAKRSDRRWATLVCQVRWRIQRSIWLTQVGP